MNLEQLVFAVDTKQLDEAVAKLGLIANATEKVNRPMQKMKKVSEESAEALEKKAKAQDKVTTAEEASTAATKKSVTQLERQQDILKFMTEGYSRGQAAILATAKAAGALQDELQALGKVVVTQRTLMGTDPFDKSIGAMQALANEYKVMQSVQRLYNGGLELTKAQMEDLTRERIRLIEKFKIERDSLTGTKRTYTELRQELKDLKQAYVQTANAENAIASSMKNHQKETIAAAKANEYIERELEKVRFATQNVNSEFSKGASNNILKFEQALKKSGMSLQQQGLLLDEFRQKQLALNKAGGNKQVDYLSRALGPQITDIFVGLATGQSPLMVLLQQGGQLRDQFALAGVAGQDMAKMLTTAATSMISSVKQMALAVGGLLVNAFVGAGKAVLNFGMTITGLNPIIESINLSLKAMEATGNTGLGFKALTMVIRGLAAAATVLTGILTGVGIAALISYGVATYQVIKQEDNLVKALALTGGSLGLNKDSAIALAREMNGVGVSTSAAIDVITAMAKEGGFLTSQIQAVTLAATELKKYGGVAIEDTVKSFAKMQDDPVKAMYELAKATGLVSVETIRAVAELEKQGRTTEATALAIKTLADVNSQQVNRMKADYNSFSLAIIEMGSGIAKFFKDSFRAMVYSTDPRKALEDRANYLRGELKGGFITPAKREAKKEELRLLEKSIGLLDSSAVAEQKAAEAKMRNAQLDQEADRLRAASLPKIKKAQEQILEWQNKKNELLALGNTRGADGFQMAIDKANKEIADELKKKDKDITYPGREAADAWADAYKNAKNILDDATGAVNKLNRAEQALMEYRQSTFFSKHSVEMQQYVITQLESASAAYKQAEADKAAAKEAEKAVKAREQYAKSYETFSNQLESINLRSEEEVRAEAAGLQVRLDVLGKTEEQALKINRAYEYNEKLAKIELQYAKDSLRIKQALVKLQDDPAAYAAAIVQQMKLDEDRAERIKSLNKEVAVQAAEDFQKEFDRIRDSLADALTTALFEGAEAGKKKLRDILVAELRKPITIQIQAVVQTVMNGLTGGAGNSIFGGGSSGGIFNNLLSKGTGLLTGGSSIAAGVGTEAALGASFESYMGSQGILASSGGTSAGLMGAVGAAMPYIGAALAVASLLESPKGGPKTEDRTSIAKSITDQYKAIAKEFGLSTANTHFTAFSSQDTMGDALTQLEVALTRENGVVYSRNERLGGFENVGRSPEELQAAISEETLRVIFAALLTSDLEEKYRKYINNLGDNATVEDMQNALARLSTARELEARLLSMTSSEEERIAEARRLELAALDAMLHPLMQQIYLQEDLARNVEKANATLDKAFNEASTVVNREIQKIESDYDSARKALETTSEAMKKSSDALKSLNDLLKGTLSKYATDATTGIGRTAAQAQINSALQAARQGTFVEADKIRDALEVYSAPSSQLYSTLEEYIFGRKQEELTIKELQELTGTQLTTEELALEELKKQGDALEATKDAQIKGMRDLLTAAQDQINAINGVFTATMTVSEAMNLLASAINGARSAGAATGNTSNPVVATNAVTDIYKNLFGTTPDTEGLEFWTNKLMQGESLASVTAQVKTSGDWVNANLPKYADGGLAFGPSMVGERGMEVVDFQTPGRVYTADQTRGMFADRTEEVQELRALNSRLERVEASLVSIAFTNHTVAKKTTEMVDRGVIALNNPEGETLEVSSV